MEDDFILFKQGLLVLKKKEPTKTKRVVPPEVLYIVIKSDFAEHCLDKGLLVSKNEKIQLFKTIEEIKNSNRENISILQIESLLMYKKDYLFFI